MILCWQGPPSDRYGATATLWAVVALGVVVAGRCSAAFAAVSTLHRAVASDAAPRAALFVGTCTLPGSDPSRAGERRPEPKVETSAWSARGLTRIARGALVASSSFWRQPARLAALRSSPPDESASSSCSSSSSSTTSKKKKRRLYSFVEARNMARQYGFKGRQEYVAYECPGAYQLPKNPEEVYTSEWAGWDDYLGRPWTYEEGRELARALEVESLEEYLECWQSSGVRDDPDLARLPYRPDQYYGEDWVGWDDWLGTPTT